MATTAIVDNPYIFTVETFRKGLVIDFATNLDRISEYPILSSVIVDNSMSSPSFFFK
jgi:hypothetical protein